MSHFRRTGRPDDDPKLDEQLSKIFDDGRTPGAPESLFSYLREVSMDSSTDPGRGRLWFLRGLGRMSRTAAALTAILIIVAGAIAVTVVIPRAGGVGAGPTAESSLPVAPNAPAGWRFQSSFGSSGSHGGLGSNLLPPAPRIAIHVICNGPDELIVMASTEGSDTPEGRPLQAARFTCSGEGRVVLVAATGQFQGVLAVVVRGFGSIADTSYVVSIEVPDESPSPSPSR
ncbi:MAG TPA: hypothetical protein VF344_00685 [Candidatus Limnocylindrales bacterium]